MKTFTVTSLLVLSLTFAASAQQKDIVDTAVGAGNFKTLVAAVKAAGLVDTLKGQGPFTVFAPTDEAFAKIPKNTLRSLLKPGNKDQLTAILTYHVVPGKIKAGDILKTKGAKTVEGSPVKISLNVNDAKVIATDIECSNGVIHVIDSVIMPPMNPEKKQAQFSLADEKGRMLFNFENPAAARSWQTYNDDVMGGRSIGRMKIVKDKKLEFSGRISTENDGGFASVISRGANLRLKSGDVIVARVRGDGRQYLFNLRYSRETQGPRINGRRRPWGYSYRQSFETKKGEWIEVQLPVDKSVATFRGKAFPKEKFDPKKVTGMSFLVKDKKPGPFKLEVEWIKVVEPTSR